MHLSIQQYDIDMIVSKNSGGQSTIEKLNVAREKNIPVVMLSRPIVDIPIVFNNSIFDDMEKCEAHIINNCSASRKINDI